MTGQRRRQGSRVVIDDQDLACTIRYSTFGGGMREEELVGGIPGTESFLRLGWIARETEIALWRLHHFINKHRAPFLRERLSYSLYLRSEPRNFSGGYFSAFDAIFLSATA